MRRTFTFYSIAMMLFMTTNLFAQTVFDWESAISNGTNATQTVEGITATVTSSNNDVDVINGEGFAGSSGNVVFNLNVNMNTFFTVSFSSAVNIASVFAFDADAMSGSPWTFTPTGGTNNPVSQFISSNTGSTVNLDWTDITSFTITSSSTFETFGLDNITLSAPCTDPDVPIVTSSPATICTGNNSSLTITGNLNDAIEWKIYTGSCGGTLVGSTAGTSFVVSPSSPSTTYYVRGEGGCVTPGSCGAVTVSVTNQDDASFNYSSDAYCADAADPTPTITGLGGGTFTSTAGLSINASSGLIDVSASTPGTYTVTYTTAGTCPNVSHTTITVNALDDASFTYSSAAYCVDTFDPTPTITGLGGGTFSSTAGLSISASSGLIDVSSSTPGTYMLTYTTAGTCPNASHTTVTINALDDASFAYSSASYCVDAADPTPTITGLAGGTFSSTAGLSISASSGLIDVSASTPGTYTVTYTTAGTCPNSANTIVTINALDDASFAYSSASYCVDATDPTPTITGLVGGTFSSTAGLSISASSGLIDVSASTPGTYTVTYTTAGTCPNSSNVSITISQVDTTVQLNGSTISSNAVGATYQWLDCDNGMSLIEGATNSSYTATRNGSYAVQVTQNGCTGISECQTVIATSIDEVPFEDEFKIYPNPTDGHFSIEFGNQRSITVIVYTAQGQFVERRVFENSDLVQMELNHPSGIYLLEIQDDSGHKTVVRLVKK